MVTQSLPWATLFDNPFSDENFPHVQSKIYIH